MANVIINGIKQMANKWQLQVRQNDSSLQLQVYAMIDCNKYMAMARAKWQQKFCDYNEQVEAIMNCTSI